MGMSLIVLAGLCGCHARSKPVPPPTPPNKPVQAETQLKQLNAEIDKIDADVKKNMGRLAAQEVEVEHLTDKLAKMKEQQAKQREQIVAMDKALDSDQPTYDGKKYSKAELTLKLETAANAYQARKTEIKANEQILAAKQEAAESGREQVAAMKEQRDALRIKSADLEARIQSGKSEKLEADDKAVRKSRELLDKLDRKVAEEEKKAELYQKYGVDKDDKGKARDPKSAEEIRRAARKVLEEDDEKDAPKRK
jgi:hypothetical protein